MLLLVIKTKLIIIILIVIIIIIIITINLLFTFGLRVTKHSNVFVRLQSTKIKSNLLKCYF